MRYFDEVTLQTVKTHALENLHFYSKDTDVWVADYLGDESAIINHSRKMKFGPEPPSNYDSDNAQVLHELYKDIPIELASEESFWAYLVHTEFWEYMLRRWPVDGKETTLNTRYFFGKDKPYYRNGLSRLWWYAYTTYDKELDDPYYYTKIALKEQERAAILLETVNLSRNRVALFATLDVLNMIDDWKANDEIHSIKDERNVVLRPLMQYVNAIGGVMIWDLLSPEEATAKIMIFIEQLKDDEIIKFKPLVLN
ncbi:DUF6339 family protein [Bacillus sp. 179-C3.3 HS]|uniref:DUF6339 family protein n=1 Tax=Bacillus sp. 179-C3.3 HS TaxID=3232162 RepID=UPI0039A368F2